MNRFFNFKNLLIAFSIFAIVNITSCSKQSFITSNAKISFSTDTLSFDTVFTTQGSVTKYFTIHNNNNKWLKINNIKLGRGSASAFRLNINGKPTNNISNVDIAPFDSLYVFVAVTVDASNVNNPFVIDDSVQVTYNNNLQKSLPLIAYGQNAIYLDGETLQGNIVWNNIKPIVIINSILIDSTATLTIQAGTRIYMHANSKFFVKGTLIANGTKTDSIVFQGDRLDRDYFGGDIAGEWCGLHFLEKSRNNILNYCVVKNGGAAWKLFDEPSQSYYFVAPGLIYLEPNETGITSPKLIINNCFVGLSISTGIVAFNSSMQANNCLIYACGGNNFAAQQGGNYNFKYCTIANFGYYTSNLVVIKHDKTPVLGLTNYFATSDTSIITAPLNAVFTNCIIDGNATEGNEVAIDNVNAIAHSVNFDHCILKTKSTITGIDNVHLDATTIALLNATSGFTNASKLNFQLESSSAAKTTALPLGNINIDIIDKPRSATEPSIGCYE
jgi:hypothetical protein